MLPFISFHPYCVWDLDSIRMKSYEWIKTLALKEHMALNIIF